jgi:hypothetical protein
MCRKQFERAPRVLDQCAARIKAGEFQNGHEALSALVKAWRP